MTEKPDNIEVTEAVEPDLNPLYQPAQTDSELTIRFVGNTAVVGVMKFTGAPGVDPYQMLAASRDLERRAFQMLQAAEIEEARERDRNRVAVGDPRDLARGAFKS